MSDFIIEDGIVKKYIGSDEKVIIPQGVTEIGNYSFWQRKNIKEIEIPESVKYIDAGAFFRCINLYKIKIPEGVTHIEECAFWYCSSLEEIKLPSTLTSIGRNAFYECSNLCKLKLTSSVSYIGEGAFCGCRSLQNENGFVIIKNTLYDYCGKEHHVVIPEGVNCIGSRAFAGHRNLEKIEIPPSVTRIGTRAFEECMSLQNIELPSGVIHIGAHAFEGCESLQKIEISSKMVRIGEHAFKKCDALQEIILDNGICESVLDEIYDKASANKIMVNYSMLKYVPEFICKDEQKREKLKENRIKIFEWALKFDDVETIDTLFALCKVIEKEELYACLEKSKDSICVRGYLVDYINKHLRTSDLITEFILD